MFVETEFGTYLIEWSRFGGGAMTSCTLQKAADSEEGTTFTIERGNAFRHNSDSDDGPLGRRLALTRAITNMGLPRPERRALWAGVWKAGLRKPQA